MKDFLRALDEGRVREVFGSGTACQVCPVNRILYQGKVRWGCPWRRERRRGRRSPWLTTGVRLLPQDLHIPTMENGPELVLRFHKELKDIQVRCTPGRWAGGWFPREVHVPCASGLRAPTPTPASSPTRR